MGEPRGARRPGRRLRGRAGRASIVGSMGYYIDHDGDPIETDDVPEDDYADHLPDFWTGPPEGPDQSMSCVDCGKPTADTSPFGMCAACRSYENPLPGWDEWTGERRLP
jgi:hypothetical protein